MCHIYYPYFKIEKSTQNKKYNHKLYILLLSLFCDKILIPSRHLLEIENDKGICFIQNRLFLHSRCEGLLCAFFTCIGQRKHGEKLKMNWNEVVGARGRAKIGHREYNGNIYNDIKRFYAPDESAPKKSFTPGKF